MSKKLIIVAAVAGLVNFTGAFALAWFTKAAPPATSSSGSDKLNQPMFAGETTELKLPQQAGTMMGAIRTDDKATKKTIKEKQFKSLIYEAREKIQEYDNKLNDFELREQRLEITHDMIKKDIEKLNNLQIQLASIVAGLKEQREKLLKSRLEISRAEKNNLASIAAAYDKMDAASAGKILINISRSQDSSSGSDNDNLDEAVKILHYMTERTKAKLLAELVNSEPKLAADLCRRMKQIMEKE